MRTLNLGAIVFLALASTGYADTQIVDVPVEQGTVEYAVVPSNFDIFGVRLGMSKADATETLKGRGILFKSSDEETPNCENLSLPSGWHRFCMQMGDQSNYFVNAKGDTKANLKFAPKELGGGLVEMHVYISYESPSDRPSNEAMSKTLEEKYGVPPNFGNVDLKTMLCWQYKDGAILDWNTDLCTSTGNNTPHDVADAVINAAYNDDFRMTMIDWKAKVSISKRTVEYRSEIMAKRLEEANTAKGAAPDL